ncbi:MAG: FeoB-associated Cys-rich membrane protein, partial [Lachnospiraceae bacterium]|nr:FeoB-associated Cys-rich membrane protein [Lachnospiraceae bacterium]
IVFFAVRYIYKEKKKGNKCIGCPYAGSCGHMGHPEQDE